MGDTCRERMVAAVPKMMGTWQGEAVERAGQCAVGGAGWLATMGKGESTRIMELLIAAAWGAAIGAVGRAFGGEASSL